MPKFTFVESLISLIIALEVCEKINFKFVFLTKYFIGETLILMFGILFLASGDWLNLTWQEQSAPRLLFLSFTYIFIIRMWRKITITKHKA